MSRSKNTKFIWTIFTIISQNKIVWNIINRKATPFKTSQWEGWILCYIANHNFRNYDYKSDMKNPFKPSYVNTIDRIVIKLESPFPYNNEEIAQNLKECINTLFHDFEKIRCIQFKESELINMKQDIIIAIFEESDQINVKYDNLELQTVIVIRDLQGFNK